MALTLKLNPYAFDDDGNKLYRGNIYVSKVNLRTTEMESGDLVAYPTRIARATDPAGRAGFLNLLEVTSDNSSDLRQSVGQPFSLRLANRKLIVVRRVYDNADETLRIWFIAKWKRNDSEAVRTVTTSNLVLTIETDEGYDEGDIVTPPIVTEDP